MEGQGLMEKGGICHTASLQQVLTLSMVFRMSLYVAFHGFLVKNHISLWDGDTPSPALSWHHFLFHCLKPDSDLQCSSFQLVLPVLWHLFGFNFWFLHQKVWNSRSEFSKEFICVCTNVWKSLGTTNYQPFRAQCLGIFCFCGGFCLPFLLSAFQPILLKDLALPGALFIRSCCLLHSEDPSISVWNKDLLCRIKSHHITAKGNRMQWALLFVHRPSSLSEVSLFEMNEADKSVASKATLLLWALLIESPVSTVTRK